ncbi:MAG: DegV family protein [Chloroflexi bacterium]|jgi:DegV family protein with EDD domain|nr:DegV family protein [Anaerolineaceae bacterium]NMB88787.1 DegV family protein [Chloroflexota bacterium]
MIQIIADTTSSIPVSKMQELGIFFVPQIIIFGEDSYRDDYEIDSATFVRRLRASVQLPKTAAPPPALYTPIYKQLAEAGDTMIVICPSAEVSGTVRSATVAAQEFPDADIRIIDTRAIGSTLGSIVLQSKEWVQAGIDADTLVERIKSMSSRQKMYFIVDTLEYLHKGGRIGGAQALLGSILQVKPILTMNDGRAEPVESCRTKRRALARALELVLDEYPKNQTGYLSIMQGDAEEEAVVYAHELSEQLGIKEIQIYNLPPAILVHVGPGVIAVGFFKPETPE